MIRFTASVIGGLTLGGTLALISLGLVLAYRATHTFNFAHGQLMVFPAFIVGWAFTNGYPVLPALGVAILATAGIASLFYFVALRRTTGLPLFMGIIATFGLAAIVDGMIGLLFKNNQFNLTLPLVPTGTVRIGGVGISKTALTFAFATLVLAVVVVIVVRKTHLGMKIRAAGQNPTLASQGGIQVGRIHLASWAVAGALAALAGVSYGSVTLVNTSMIHLGLAALPAIVLGGIDSVEGAVVGGVIVGLLQGFTQTYLGGEFVDVVTYTLLLVTLLFLPQGIFGTKQALRA